MEQPFFFFAHGRFFFSSFISTNTLVRSLHFEFFLFARRFAFFFSSGYGDRVPTVPLGGRIVSDHGQVRGAPIMRGIKKNRIFRDQTRGAPIMRVRRLCE